LQRNCGNLQNIDTTFQDAAPTRFSSFCPVEPGRGPFQGNEPLANSNSESSLGVWRLAIQNNGSDVRAGFLRTFSITITGTPITRPTFTADTVVSDASGVGGSVAPGERIRIYGSGLGPATPASAPAGDAPPTLSGTTVVIDNIRAAVLYASSTMVIVQVPYGEIPGTGALIQVGYNDQTSDVIALPVRRARPAIYTVGADNRQAKAFSEYGQLNSRDNPAPKGGTLVFYASGLGVTDPLLSSGLSTPTNQLFYALYPIGVYIGDVQVPVSFAGLAPGLNGIYQINVQVPEGVNSGQQDLVIVASNGAVSQSTLRSGFSRRARGQPRPGGG
jgi:uncharacterized protein (TIGR03437 family)